MNTNELEYYFVYGTLKKGHGNNRILKQSTTATFIEDGITEPKFTMISLGPFPGVFENGNTAIHGEIWSVKDIETKNRLDSLEDYRKDNPNSLYYKKQIKVNNKTVNIYILNDIYKSKTNQIIKSGIWN
jgi:gamma-glutamylcyclotransferase (GGCT)/AIG2-like uncharacterized protein YtfP